VHPFIHQDVVQARVDNLKRSAPEYRVVDDTPRLRRPLFAVLGRGTGTQARGLARSHSPLTA
jgi:hypothetical protein